MFCTRALSLLVALAVVLSRVHVTLTKRIGEIDLGVIKTKIGTSLTQTLCISVHRGKSRWHRRHKIDKQDKTFKQNKLNKNKRG